MKQAEIYRISESQKGGMNPASPIMKLSSEPMFTKVILDIKTQYEVQEEATFVFHKETVLTLLFTYMSQHW